MVGCMNCIRYRHGRWTWFWAPTCCSACTWLDEVMIAMRQPLSMAPIQDGDTILGRLVSQTTLSARSQKYQESCFSKDLIWIINNRFALITILEKNNEGQTYWYSNESLNFGPNCEVLTHHQNETRVWSFDPFLSFLFFWGIQICAESRLHEADAVDALFAAKDVLWLLLGEDMWYDFGRYSIILDGLADGDVCLHPCWWG